MSSMKVTLSKRPMLICSIGSQVSTNHFSIVFYIESKLLRAELSPSTSIVLWTAVLIELMYM
jgi:hypothetical protein